MPLRPSSIAVLLLALVIPTPTLAAELTPFTATYSANYSGIDVTAERKLSGGDGNWRLDFTVESFLADIREYSRFSAKNGTLNPLHYEYHRTGLVSDRHRVLNFEADQQRVVNVSNPERTLENVPRAIQDKITYQLQLAMDVAAGKKTLVYRVADGKRIREYRFAISGREKLQTPLGPVETVRVQRVRDADSERETILWLAPEWNYALVKLMQQEEDGETYQINLTKLIIDEKTVDAHQ